MNKKISLFVSPSGKRVAVVIWNQITVFHSSDNYQKPCGVYKNDESGFFTCGIWSESQNIIGILDDSGTLIFIQEHGEELLKIERKHLNFRSPIIYFRFNDDTDINDSYLFTVDILTSDGLLHCVEISENLGFSLSSTHAKGPYMGGMTFPNNSLCLDYSPDLSLLALVGNVRTTSWISKINKGLIFGPKFGYSGPFHLSIWRMSTNSCLEPLFSVEADGEFFKPEGYMGSLTHPKVMFSPGGRFVSMLDLVGTLNIFNIDEDGLSLLRLVRTNLNSTDGGTCISDLPFHSSDIITDFVWLSDQVITFSSSMRGVLTMIDVITGLQLSKDDTVYFTPVLESAKKSKGLFFLLEITSLSYPSSSNASHFVEMSDPTNVDDKNCWRLVSFSEGYVAEMYYFLIESKQYENALRFADNHGLEKDEVFKSQWLCSEKTLHEINSFLLKIKDKDFALGQCMINVASDEVSMRGLLTHGIFLTESCKFSIYDCLKDEDIWGCRLQRLKLLQFQDRLETFMGINMGRYSANEYTKFRSMPIEVVAISLSEAGKIGALNLLFKRHSLSLVPSMLKVLSAVPETVPVDSYSQILPGRLPPKASLREKDWVENEEMVSFLSDPSLSFNIDIMSSITEPIVQYFLESTWPSAHDLCLWYKNRARDIDTCSGYLDNCLALINCAFGKDLWELQEFRADISYLHHLVYSIDSGQEALFLLSISSWEKLSDDEKFKMMLTRVEGETLVQRLHEIAVPFMKSRISYDTRVPENGLRYGNLSVEDGNSGSLLIRWLKDIASNKQLELCLMVIEEGCKSFLSGIFKDGAEAVSGALECIYSCEALDKWNIMDEILSNVQQIQDDILSLGDLWKRLELTAGYIEAGRILSFYQVSKPLYYFLEAGSDEKGVKQIIRLMLSKFIRRKHCSDNDWADMWRDMQFLYDKAFPFLDLEYMFLEFFRGLLKAGRFSLAKNYLHDMVHLSIDKAEIIVIQTSREYLFSASSLNSPEIWKATECLKLLPKSGKVNSEIEIIEALTVKLPELGVTLLPIQLKEIKDPMVIVKTMMASQPNVHSHFDHILTITKQLGLLNSPHDISSIEEAIAREAAIAGDLQLALTLCLVLAKKGNGSIWDLCAAIARGPPLDSMDWFTRKTLLGFALSHCDEQSIGELLQVWKDMDLHGQCGALTLSSSEEEYTPLLDTLIDTKDVFFTNVKLLLYLFSAQNISNSAFPLPETVSSALKSSSSHVISENFLQKLHTLDSDALCLLKFCESNPTDAPGEPSNPSESTGVVPGLEKLPDEPLTMASATSCFITLCEAPDAESHLDDLPSLLERWGRNFRENVETEASTHVEDMEIGNWDEGWEKVSEKSLECKTESSVFLHPLHTCWLLLFKKLVMLGRFTRVRILIKTYETVLLDEEESMALILQLLKTDCFEALKISLLLPYSEVQLCCISAVEKLLKATDGGIPEEMEDAELLLLLLFSDMVKKIITEPEFEAMFSCLCQIIGLFCGRMVGDGKSVVFRRVIFPCFVAQLVVTGRILAAGFVLVKAAGLEASVAGINVTEVGLRRYLQNQVVVVDERWGIHDTLVCPLSSSFVRDSLNSLLNSALLLLSF